jgi:hypothetical protein
VDIRTLAAKFHEGRDRIAEALRELEDQGYIERARERTPDGRIITRTFSYNDPQGTRARRTASEAAEQPTPPSPPAPPPAPDPAPPVPQPETETGEESRPPAEPPSVAAALLADLRRHDDRLLLSQRDVHRLAPAVAAWLERGAGPDAVRRTLTASLPADLRRPAALLSHRLTELLPPSLPSAPAPTAEPRPIPLQNCDGCDRAFRAPEPGHCRDCRRDQAPQQAHSQAAA